MRNQPRDVTGGEQMMSALIPGYGPMNYLLGWIAVTIEVFLRRGFGERYFTKPNFIAGLIILCVFRFFSSVVGMLNPFRLFSGSSDDTVSLMGPIIKWYIILGIMHFLRIWWNNITGDRPHSFNSGRSWLRSIGKVVIWGLNLILDPLARVLVRVLRGDKERLEDSLPVLQDVDTFTERFIEPLVLLILAFFALKIGQTAVFFWLLFSIMAHSTYTGQRHQAERSYVLDILDQIEEGRQLQEAMQGPKRRKGRSQRLERIMKETAKEAEKAPEILNTIRNDHPSLAAAVAAMNARKQKAHTGETSPMEV